MTQYVSSPVLLKLKSGEKRIPREIFFSELFQLKSSAALNSTCHQLFSLCVYIRTTRWN